MLDKNKIVDIIIADVNKKVNDSYVRGEMYKDTQLVSVNRIKIINAFRDAYVKLYENTSEERVGGALPAPAEVEKAGIFKVGAREAIAYVNDHIDSNRGGNRRKAGSPRNTNYAIFLQTHQTADGKRRIFTKIKSIGIKVLNTYLEEIKGVKGLSTAGEVMESEGIDRGPAIGKSEDIYYRRFIHREHLGKTTTGAGTISARLLMYGRLVEGATEALFTSKKSQSLTDLIGDITTTFTSDLTKEGLIQVKANAPIGLSLGSFKLNAPGIRANDLKVIGPVFDKHVKKVLASLPLGQLETFASAKQLHQHLANEITEYMGVRIDGAVYSKAKIAAIQKANREKRERTTPDNVGSVTDRPMTGGVVSQSEHTNWSEEAIRAAAFLKLELNKRLKQQVAGNMKEPALVYRTGRFANSVLVTDVTVTPKQRIPSIEYTYQLYPYQVFQTGHMYTPDRDPTKLIDKSIREIAAQMMITKLSLRRPR